MRTVSRRAFLRSIGAGLGGPVAARSPGRKGADRAGRIFPSQAGQAFFPRRSRSITRACATWSGRPLSTGGRGRAASEAKIKPGSWVVIKPNLGSLPPRQSFLEGDVTDLRVTRAVLEYVAAQSQAARITLAEGGTYRRVGDPGPDNVMLQNGVHVDALTYAWGDEFPGFQGTIGAMLQECPRPFPRQEIRLRRSGLRSRARPVGRVPLDGCAAQPQRSGRLRREKGLRPRQYHRQLRLPDHGAGHEGSRGVRRHGVPQELRGNGVRASFTRRRGVSRTAICTAIIRSKAGSTLSLPTWRRFILPDYCVVDAIRGLAELRTRDPRSRTRRCAAT